MKAKQERKKEELVEIDKYIDSRCEAIQGELKYMLNSLLEKPAKKIKIDRVVRISRGERVLLTESDKVLGEVRTYFIN